ncbi:MAG: hypothetical protein IT204_22070 [Fimbriimonadaceae bacterium]|nr:hypothetical protein [Fimbriimonadaceae bacterium]
MTAGLLSLLLLASPADTYLEVLRDFERYAESVWHDAPPGGYFGDGASGGNAGIRGTCGVLLAYATLLRADGHPPARRLDRLERGLRYAAETHRSGPARCVDGQQWGHGWQTALWCGSLAGATLLVEDRLSPATVAAVRRAVASEATYRAAIAPASGHIGDSKAEENGWNSNVTAVAAAWLRDDQRAAAWREAARRYLVNTYTVPPAADDPFRELVTTQTLYPSFACENHGFFHPEYQMVAGMSCGDSYVLARLADPATAAELRPAAEYHHLEVWRCLQIALLDSGEFAFPASLDWALHSYGQISYLAWLACHFGDSTARWAEERVATLLRARQQVNGDGRITGESVPNGFYREAVGARRVALAWWQHQLAERPSGPTTPPPDGTFHLPDVKLIVRRDRHGYVSLSYGAKVMALVHPPAAPGQPYLTTPRSPGLLAGARSASQVTVEPTPDGFRAQLLLQCGPLEERRVVLATSGGVTALLELPRRVLLQAGRVLAFPLGIENHALTGSHRQLTSGGGAQRIAERGGQTAERLGRWASVDDRLTVLAGPAGDWTYRAADRYNRGGAAEDCLDWVPADPLAPRYAVILTDGRSAARTALEARLQWQLDATAASLQVAPLPRLSLPREQSSGAVVVGIRSVRAVSESAQHPAAQMIDGAVDTFWVSGGNAQPGEGPTPQRPVIITLTPADDQPLRALVIVPRPGYGPREVELVAGERLLWRGQLQAEPRQIDLPAGTTGELTLRLLSSYDPREPTRPRNVQIAELVLLR